MRELSVAEQRYQAVQAVLFEGRTVTDVAAAWGVSRQSVHTWLARYEADGRQGLVDRSSRPRSSPVQMPVHVEAVVIQLRTEHRTWGARRIVHELRARALVAEVDLPSESGVYRALKQLRVVPGLARGQRDGQWAALAVDSQMNLAGQFTVGASEGFTLTLLDGAWPARRTPGRDRGAPFFRAPAACW